MQDSKAPRGAVVVGIDGSPASERAVVWGARQAALERRPIVLVHAASPTVATTWMGAPAFNPATVLQALEDSGRAQLESAASAVRAREPDLEIYQVLDHRDPRDALLALARAAALVVVGSRGRGPMASLLLGSVSLAVSQHASCPVVVLRQDGEDQHGGIVVGTDGTVRSDAALGFAFRQASLTAMPLAVVHAFWSEQDEGYPSAARDYGEADLEDMRLLLAEATAGPASDHPEVKVTLHVERGIPDSVLLHACRTAELVVVGTHPTNAVYDLFAGEVSRSVLGHAHCAVAVVPDTV
jgi:nucleotide-binding universal stress UspA family protein